MQCSTAHYSYLRVGARHRDRFHPELVAGCGTRAPDHGLRPMHVIILERNKLVGRKLARLFLATGASAVTVDEPAALGGAIDGADVVCADAFDGDAVVEQLRARPDLRGVLWTAEPLRRSLRYLVESSGINHV